MRILAQIQKQDSEKGFALLYALLVISILLSVSASIFTIFISELKITTFGKSSELAFYAAETGAECVYYWVLRGTVFDGSTNISCAGQTVSATSPLTLAFPPAQAPDGPCATVTVAAGVVRAYGYNTCATTKLRVERGLEILY